MTQGCGDAQSPLLEKGLSHHPAPPHSYSSSPAPGWGPLRLGGSGERRGQAWPAGLLQEGYLAMGTPSDEGCVGQGTGWAWVEARAGDVAPSSAH